MEHLQRLHRLVLLGQKAREIQPQIARIGFFLQGLRELVRCLRRLRHPFQAEGQTMPGAALANIFIDR